MKKLVPFIIIGIIWFGFASPYLLKGLVPFPSRYLVTFFQPWQPNYGMPSKNNAMPDIITQIYPWRHLSLESMRSGGWGLWNPYSFSGSVHAGNYQSAPFYPLNLVLLLPFLDGWSILILLQPLAAGLFMYVFVRSLQRSVFASLLASISFMFCGFMTVWLEYGTLGWSVVYLPLVLMSIQKMSQIENTMHHGVLISVGIGLSFLSGHFQMSLYVLLVALGFLLTKSKKVIVIGTIFIVLGLLLALPQLSVTFDAFLSSNRSESFITNAGIPIRYLITLLAPDFFGHPVTRNDWFGQYAEWSSYIGILPLFFALFSLFVYRKKEMSFFVGLLIVSLLLAIASPVSQLFYDLHIPVLSTSVATRMIVFVSFSLIVLASFGLDALTKISFTQVSTSIRYFVFSWVFFISSIWFILLTRNVLDGDALRIAQRNFILPSMIVSIGIVLLIISIITKKLRWVMLSIVIGITIVDMLRFSNKWIPFEEREYVYPEVEIVSTLKKTVGNDRLFSNIGNELYTYFKIPSIEGYDAMYQARYGEFISAAADGSIKPLDRSVVRIDRGGMYTQRWFDLLGIRYVLHRISDGRNSWVFPHWEHPQYRSIHHDDHYELFENSTAVPRAFLVSDYVVKTEKQEIISELIREDFSVLNTIVLEQNPEIEPQKGQGTATIDSYKPHSIVIRAQSTTPQLLYLSDVYDKGWHVTVNGISKKIYRANYAFRAVTIPQGESVIIFTYFPRSFQIGVIGFIVASFVLIGISMRQFIYGRRLL